MSETTPINKEDTAKEVELKLREIVKASYSRIVSVMALGKTKGIKDGDVYSICDAVPLFKGDGVIQEDTPRDFCNQLINKTDKLCHIYGLPNLDEFKILSANKYNAMDPADPDKAITILRKKEFFSWAKVAGILCWDFDPHEYNLTREEFEKIVYRVLPELKNHPHIFHVSSSSHLCINDEDVTGVKGQRLYVFVKDASLIESSIKLINEKLWLAGFGKYRFSRAGDHLDDAPIDTAFTQASRLDFVGGAILKDGLTQNTPEPDLRNGDADFFDLSTIEPLDGKDVRAVDELKAIWKREHANERACLIDEYADTEVAKNHPFASKDEKEILVKMYKRAATDHVLFGDFILHMKSGKKVTVLDLLTYPDKFTGKDSKMCDPLEPEYGNWDGTKAMFHYYRNKGGSPFIKSFAHGEQYYKLKRSTRTIIYNAESFSLIIDECFRALADEPNVFIYMGKLCLVDWDRHKIHQITEMVLAYVLSEIFEFIQLRKSGSKEPARTVIRCPPTLVKTILEMKHRWGGIKELNGISSRPLMFSDGRVVSTPGYDDESRIFNTAYDWKLSLPESVTDEELIGHYNNLMLPFKEWQFDGPASHGSLIGAILLVAMRPTLPKAPGWHCDAPVKNSGKTLIQETMSVLISGNTECRTTNHKVENKEEFRKQFAAELSRGSDYFIIDNMKTSSQIINDPVIDQAITASTFSGRILSSQEINDAPNRLFFMTNGNNVQYGGDTAIRMLITRIDTGSERPGEINHSFRPIDVALKHREKIINSSIIIMREALRRSVEKGLPVNTAGKFPGYHATVGAGVELLNEVLTDVELISPNETLRDTDNDPERDIFVDLFTAIHKKFKYGKFTASDYMNAMNGIYDTNYPFSSYVPVTTPEACSGGLRGIKDRIVDNVKFVCLPKKAGEPHHFKLLDLNVKPMF